MNINALPIPAMLPPSLIPMECASCAPLIATNAQVVLFAHLASRDMLYYSRQQCAHTAPVHQPNTKTPTMLANFAQPIAFYVKTQLSARDVQEPNISLLQLLIAQQQLVLVNNTLIATMFAHLLISDVLPKYHQLSAILVQVVIQLN